MLATNYTDFRNNMKKKLDVVSDEYETLIITRKHNKNVIVISEDKYNNLLENIHVFGNQTNSEWIEQSVEQLDNGHSVERNTLL